MEHDRLTALEMGELIARRELSPITLIEQALDRANAADAVFISLCRQRALAEAEAAERRARLGYRTGPLDGVPLAWKDLFNIAGTVTTAGSLILSQTPASRDAGAVRNASRAGLVTLGKTNLSELAYSGLGLNPHYGTPHHTPGSGPARVPGGSSSGSAVAVASGIVAAAVGSDTAGSLRVPAAFNGLVSYRPSQTRHDMTGVTPLAPVSDTIGVIAHRLVDCIAVDDAMRGSSPVPRPAVDPRQVTLLLDTHMLDNARLSPAVRNNLLSAAEALKAAGFNVVKKPVDTVRRVMEMIRELGWLGSIEAYTRYRHLLETPEAERLDQRVRTRLAAAASMAPDTVVMLYQRRRQLIQAFEQELAGACLLGPTVAHVAPELAPLEQNNERFARFNLQTLWLTMVASILDAPTIALPTGCDEQGQFTSLQISASSGHDEHLIGTATAVSDALALSVPAGNGAAQ